MSSFGKLEFYTSFVPQGAYPLDGRCYFEGATAYDQALAAAKKAKDVGNAETIYHYGMKLLVNQDGVYTWYTITKSNSLAMEGSGGSGGSVNVEAIVSTVLSRLPSDSALPHDIYTSTEMDAILSGATRVDVGSVFRFMGTSTSTYTKGELYILQEE